MTQHKNITNIYINGMVYDFDSEHATKEDARIRAREIRNSYTSVRVIKGYINKGYWNVWKRNMY